MELARSRARWRDHRGQVAIVDGIVFLSLLLLAFFFLMDVFLAPVSTPGQNAAGQSYASATLGTVLQSTFPVSQFPTRSSTVVEQDQGGAHLLTEAIYLIGSGQTTQKLLLNPGAVGWAIQLELDNLTRGTFAFFNLTVVAPSGHGGAHLDLGAQSTYSPLDLYVQQIGLPSPPGWNGPIAVTLALWNT
jgi:hypothetical protein